MTLNSPPANQQRTVSAVAQYFITVLVLLEAVDTSHHEDIPNKNSYREVEVVLPTEASQ